MTKQINITNLDNMECTILTIPDGEWDMFVIMDEFQRACQRAYNIGRDDQSQRDRDALRKSAP